MFILKIYDSYGVELNEFDWVKINSTSSYGSKTDFYCQVLYLPEQKCLSPFDKFCYHTIQKVDKLPDDVEKSNVNDGYELYYKRTNEKDVVANEYYLREWRKCKHSIDKGTWGIFKQEKIQQKLF